MKKIKTYSTVICILMLRLPCADAQFIVKKSELKENIFKENTIFFETKELSEKQINSYKDPRTIENLKIQYQEENKVLAETLKDHWVNGDKITSLSKEEIRARLKNKQETWYISLYKHTDKFIDSRIAKRNLYFYYPHYIMTLYKNKQKILSIPLVNSFVSELDIHFAVNMIQNITYEIENISKLNQYAKAINQNSSLIKQKTLLIPQNYTKYSEEHIKQFYKGNIKIVEEREIIDAIHKKDPNYAYLLINLNHLSEKPSFNHFIFDCATDNPLFLYNQSTGYVKTGIQKSSMTTLKREIQFLLDMHFKKYNSKI